MHSIGPLAGYVVGVLVRDSAYSPPVSRDFFCASQGSYGRLMV